MLIETNKQKGNAGLSLGIAYFGTQGYTVSIPLNDTQQYDFLIEKDGKISTVQCKFTSSKAQEINLRSTGGTNGSVYDNVKNHPLDFLFCANQEGKMWLIPMEDLNKASNTNRITLRTAPNANNQGFNTYQYLVQI